MDEMQAIKILKEIQSFLIDRQKNPETKDPLIEAAINHIERGINALETEIRK